MGFWSTVGSFVGSAVSAVSSAMSSIGSSLASSATKLLEMGAKYLEPVIQAIQSVGTMLGIIKPEENMEELGAKAMSADKKPEDFDSITEYIDYLRNDVTIDTEKLKNTDSSSRLASKAVGASITSRGIEEKLGSSISMEFWKEVGQQNLTSEKITKTIEAYKKNNIDTSQYSDYMKGDMSIDDKKKNSNVLFEAYKEMNPSLSTSEIEEKIMNLKKSSNE